MFDLIQKNIFGSQKDFERKYAIPIEKGLVADAWRSEKEMSKKLSDHLRKIYTPYYLWRLKTDIFKVKSVGNQEVELADDELPLKSDFVIWLQLTEYQKEFYSSILSKQKVKQIIDGQYEYSAF